MVIQIDIKGNLEKRINKLLENEYSYMSKKTLIMDLVRKQVAIEEDKRK
ncbi:hypothetical protein KA005_29430 [bacterium]|nr:hypothetical protein [bacterium]